MIRMEEKPPVPEREVAAVGTDSFARSLGYYSGDTQLNPDPILRGLAGSDGVDLFQEMEDKDPDIFSDLQTRKLAIVGLDWEVVPGGDDPADAKLAAWVGDHLNGISGFGSDLFELLDAVAKGYAVSEILWGPTRDGRIGVVEIKSRHPRRFVFDAESRLRLMCDQDTTAGIPVPDRKFLVHTFQGAYDNPYGRGVCSRIYWYYWFKKNALKFWAIYAEKFGAPTAVGKYAPGASADAKSALLAALEAIQQESAIIIPDTMTAEFLEAQRRGTIDTYSEFMAYLDRKITKAILGQTLTSSEGERSGSLALGRVHADVRQDILEADAESLRGVLNGQLIQWLVDWNVLTDVYPEFVWKLDPPEDLVQLAARDQTLQAMGVPIPRSYIQRRHGIPAPTDEQDILDPTGAGLAPGASPWLRSAIDAAFADTDVLLGLPGRRRASIRRNVRNPHAARLRSCAPRRTHVSVR